MDELNFIEKRIRREAVLTGHDEELWQTARSTVQDCCNSFRKHYDEHLKDELENGLRIRLTRTSPPEAKTRILIAFSKSGDEGPCIVVTVDDEKTKRFCIDADEDHVFITDQDHKEISANEFARIVLEPYLFKAPSSFDRFKTAFQR